MQTDIYIKPVKKASVADRQHLNLEDIAEVFAPSEIIGKLKKVKVLNITENKKTSYLVNVIDIIKAIDKALPGNTISNVGEPETLVDYKPKKSKDNKLLKFAKIAVISVTIFMGASTAIMSFHTDAQLSTVFKKYYKMFYGQEVENPLIIEIPYSIGLATGIIVFFNHFAGKKLTDDPTPIEVEMSVYEQDVTETKLDMLNTERVKGGGGKK